MTTSEETDAPFVIPRMEDDELREFVDDFLSGRIYTLHHVPDGQDPAMVFMVLALGGLPQGLDPNDVGTVYEYIDKAGPRTVNGMPHFFSCRFMHKDDWSRAVTAIEAERERRQNIPLDPRG
jgi:hypothetical protein